MLRGCLLLYQLAAHSRPVTVAVASRRSVSRRCESRLGRLTELSRLNDRQSHFTLTRFGSNVAIPTNRYVLILIKVIVLVSETIVSFCTVAVRRRVRLGILLFF